MNDKLFKLFCLLIIVAGICVIVYFICNSYMCSSNPDVETLRKVVDLSSLNRDP